MVLEAHIIVQCTLLSIISTDLTPLAMFTRLLRDPMWKTGRFTFRELTSKLRADLVILSSLQDLECRNCQTVIGMRCADAPAGHMLKK